MEQAQASHVYSYKHGFRGFAAKLTDQQASQIARKFGAIPNPNINEIKFLSIAFHL